MNIASPMQSTDPLSASLRTLWALRPLRWQRLVGILLWSLYAAVLMKNLKTGDPSQLYALSTWVPIVIGFAIASLFQDALRLAESPLLPRFHLRVRRGATLAITLAAVGVSGWVTYTYGFHFAIGTFGISALMMTLPWQAPKLKTWARFLPVGLFACLYLIGLLVGEQWLAVLGSPLTGVAAGAGAILLLRHATRPNLLRTSAGTPGIPGIGFVPAHFSRHVTILMTRGSRVSENQIQPDIKIDSSADDRSGLSFWVNRALLTSRLSRNLKFFWAGVSLPFALTLCLSLGSKEGTLAARLHSWLSTFHLVYGAELPDPERALPYVFRIAATIGLIVVVTRTPVVMRLLPLGRKRLARLHWRLAFGNAAGAAGLMGALFVVGTWARSFEMGQAWQAQAVCAAIGAVLVAFAAAPLGAFYSLLDRSFAAHVILFITTGIALGVSGVANLLPTAATPLGSVFVPAACAVISWLLYYVVVLGVFWRARLELGVRRDEDK